jgi:hypothetical protein
MTESNFAISSALAALNIVLTVSMICAWSEVTGLCWALVTTGFAEDVSATAAVARARRSLDDMEETPLGYWINTLGFYLCLDATVRESSCKHPALHAALLDESWIVTSTYSMSHLQYLSSTFADDDARGHRVAGCHTGHDRSVCDAKTIDSIDLQLAVYDRHFISSHLGSRGLMSIADGCITDKRFKGWSI